LAYQGFYVVKNFSGLTRYNRGSESFSRSQQRSSCFARSNSAIAAKASAKEIVTAARLVGVAHAFTARAGLRPPFSN
jgi:hypothetical protein